MATAIVKSPFGGHAVGDILTGAEADAALSGPESRYVMRKADPAAAAPPPVVVPAAPAAPRVELVVIEGFDGHDADTVISDPAEIAEIEQGPNAGKVRRVVI